MDSDISTAAAVSAEPGYDASVAVSTEPWYSSFVGLYVLLSVIVVSGSWLIIRAYWTTPHLQTPSNLLIFNLSLIDSMVALLSLPWVIFNYTEAGLWFVTRSKWGCLISLFMTTSTATGSMMAVLFLSLERFIAVLCPYAYYHTVTDRNIKVASVVAWLFPISLNIIPLFGWNTWKEGFTCVTMYVHNPIYNAFIASGSRAIILLLAAVLNIVICVVAFKKKKQVVGDVGQTTQENTAHDFKLTKMMLAVVGVFYLCWAPFISLTIYYMYMMRQGQAPVWLVAAQDFSILGVGLNSALNPLIYARKNKKFRAAFKKILFMDQKFQVKVAVIPSQDASPAPAMSK